MPEFGQRLSHYGITAIISKGGIGGVYRAKDQRLGGDLEIKVLPEEFSDGADCLAKQSQMQNRRQHLWIISAMLFCALIVTSESVISGDLDSDLWKAAERIRCQVGITPIRSKFTAGIAAMIIWGNPA